MSLAALPCRGAVPSWKISMRFSPLSFIAVAVCAAGFAFADYPHPPANEGQGTYRVTFPGLLGEGSTPTAACQAFVANLSAVAGRPHVFVSITGSGPLTCNYKRVSDNFAGAQPVSYSFDPDCHPEDTYDSEAGMCIHPGDEPEPESCPLDAPRSSMFRQEEGFRPPVRLCKSGCMQINIAQFFTEDGLQAVYKPTGETCEVGEDPPPDIEEAEEDEEEPGCNKVGDMTICERGPEPKDRQCYANGNSAFGDLVSCSGEAPDDRRCGFIAGAYTCVETNKRSCGSINGQLVCFARDPNGNTSPRPIPPNSPDHPRNGGNSDGNDKNDVYDGTADVGASGLSEADIKREMQRQGLARQYEDTIGGRGNYPSSGGGGNGGGGNGGNGGNGEGDDFDDSGIIDAIDGLGDRTEGFFERFFGSPEGGEAPDYESALTAAYGEATDALGGVGTNPGFSFTANTGVFSSTIGALVPAPGSCGSIPFNLHPSLKFNVDLCQLNTVRTVLAWIFYVATVFTLFALVVNRAKE